MADTETPNLELTIQTIGGNNNTWGNLINDNSDRIDDKMGDLTSIVTTGGTTVLTDTQEWVAAIALSGTLLSNAVIQFSGRGGVWVIRNAGTDGAFSLTCKCSGQTGVVIPAGAARMVFCDGTDVRLGNTDAALLLSALTLITAPAVDDLLMLGDTSNSGLSSGITIPNFFKAIALLTGVTAPAIDDGLPIYDLSGTLAGAISLLNLLKVVNGLTEDTGPDSTADFLLSYDTSASTPKKIKPNTIAAASAATATAADRAPGTLLGIYQDQKSSGVSAQSISAGSWVTRDMNTEVYDRDSNMSVGSNQITLPAGTYEVEWYTTFNRVATFLSRLYDVTNAAVLAYGRGGITETSDISCGESRGIARFTLAGSTVIRVEVWVTSSNQGGISTGLGTEIYSGVVIRKG